MPCNHCSYKNETGSWKWGLFTAVYTTLLCVCLFFSLYIRYLLCLHKKKEKYEPVCIKPAGAHLFCDVLRGSVTDKNHTKTCFFSPRKVYCKTETYKGRKYKAYIFEIQGTYFKNKCLVFFTESLMFF